MYCSKCGKKTEENTKFCSNCGNPIINYPTTPIPTNISIPIHNNSKKGIQWDINKILVIAIVFVVLIITIVVGKELLKTNNSRTIMIYMVGANLESDKGLATRDLKDLDYHQIANHKVKVLLMAGGAKTWQNNYISSDETSIYELTENGFVKIDQRKRNSMGKADNLSYFLNYSYQHSKTKKYDLLFWNHGGAVDGSEYDELTFNNDNIKLEEFKTALEKSPFNKNNKLEVVSFRTCLNATIEVANVFKDYANYLVASEEVTIGSIFDSALKFINEIEPTDNAIEYGKKQIEGYKSSVTTYCNYYHSKSEEENYCVDLTYSMIDLLKIEKLSDSFDKFSSDIAQKLTTNYNEFARIRANLNQYAVDEPAYDMIDLYDFVSHFSKYSNSAKQVLTNIESAVEYNYSNNSYSHGLSIYYPYNKDSFLNNYYEKISVSDEYTKFVEQFYQLKTTKEKNKSFASFQEKKVKVKDVKKETADFEIELTEDQVENFAKAQYMVFVDTKDGYYKLLYIGNEVKLEKNKIKANVQGKLLRFADIEYDDISNWMTVIEKEVTDDYIEVTTISFLQKGMAILGDPATMTIRIDKDNPNGTIKSIVLLDNQKDNSNSDSLKLFSNTGVRLNDYTFIIFGGQSYKIQDDSGKFNPNFLQKSSGTFTGNYLPTNQFHFIKENFSSEYDYYAVFKVEDISGQVYYSEITKMK